MKTGDDAERLEDFQRCLLDERQPVPMPTVKPPHAVQTDLLGLDPPAPAEASRVEPLFATPEEGRRAAEAVMERAHALLRRHRFLTTGEKSLQDAIAGVFTAAAWPFEREVRLADLGIIDFIICLAGQPRVGLEVKCKQGLSEVTRQLHRYAGCTQFQGLLLVTTRPLHNQMPDTMQGMPVRVTVLPGGLSR